MRTRLITQTNTGGSARLAANWVSSLHALRIAHCAEIYCTDDDAFKVLKLYCALEAIPARVTRTRLVRSPNDAVPPGVYPYGTRPFIRFTLWKLDLLLQLSDQDRFEPFLFCDPDVVLLHDPEPALQAEGKAWPGHSICFQSDRPDHRKPDAGGAQYSTGVIYQIRSTPRYWAASYAWLDSRMEETTDFEGPKYVHDQTAANAMLKLFGTIPAHMSPDWSRNGAQDWSGDPVLIHSNWVRGNATKEARLRNAGYWFAKDETLKEVGL